MSADTLVQRARNEAAPIDDPDLLDELASRIESLEAELAAVRGDATRFRWLRRANDGYHWQVSKRMNGALQQIGDTDNYYLDAAIDAAIASEAQEPKL